MPGRIDLRAALAIGRHALHPGRVPEIAELISAEPRRAARLIELLWDDDPGVASRAADVLERISHHPSPSLSRVLAEYKEALLGLLPDARFPKLRWNLAFLIPRLALTLAEARRAAGTLYTFLGDRSSIVKTAALQGLADLTRHDPDSLPAVLDLLRLQGRSGTPAMRARSHHLIQRLYPAARSNRRCRNAAIPNMKETVAR
jgi:HEAT repeat protein